MGSRIFGGGGNADGHPWPPQSRALWRRVVFLLLITFASLAPPIARAQQGLCATVSIQIQQKVSLERQAFTAELDINNGLTDASITGVGVNVLFTDGSGTSVVATTDPNNTSAAFFLRQDSLSNINATDGTGTIGPSTNAVMRWLIIPAPGAGGSLPSGAVYFVGATLTYTLADQIQTVSVNPASITVLPQPMLQLDYFLPNYVYADDPFTLTVEPPLPFTLGVRVTNVGAGTARSLTIDSAQPKIVENQQGLRIGFQLLDSYVDDKPAADTLLIDFGDVGPQQSRMGRWDMATTLSGQFTEFTANFTHADTLGGALTSLILPGGVNTHTLIHDVLVDLPGRDSVLDFLALDSDVERVYESDNVIDPVTDVSSGATIGSPSNGQVAVAFSPPTGIAYAQLSDPFNGQVAAIGATRSDGKVLPAANVWFSRTKNAGGNWVYWVNLFDVSSTGHYTLSGSVSAANSSLGGTVFGDSNSNGVLDAGESGLPGIGVHLHGTTAAATIDLDAVTDSSGNYQFSGLGAGTYAVSVGPIAQYLDGAATAGSVGGNESVGSIGGIALPAGMAATGYQFAKVPQTTTSAVADFALTTFSLSASNVTVGNSVTLNASLSNLGPSADNAGVQFVIPAGVAITASSASSGVFDPNARVWQTGTLASGATTTLSLTLQAKSTGTQTISAAAIAGAAATDPNTLNNAASASLTVNSTSTITLGKSAPTTAVTNGVLPYTIALGNSGQGTSGTTVTVADALPGGVTFTNAMPGPGVAAVICMGTTNLLCSVTLTAGLPASSPIGAASFAINTSAPDTAGAITNFASVDAAGGSSPPPPGAGCTSASCASAMTTVNTAATITLTKAGPASATTGSPMTYTIALGNSGQVASGTTLTVADALPPGAAFVSAARGTNVSAVTCTGTTTLTCTVTLTTALQAATSNGAATFTINTSAPAAAGTITNYASVDATGGITPPTPSASCSPAASCGSATTTVNDAANITLIKTGSASAIASSPMTYTIALGNSGQVASGPTLTVADALPAGMAFVGATPGTDVSTVTCTGATTLTCTVTLTAALQPAAANGAAAFSITTIAPSAAGTVTNYAAVDASGGTNPSTPGATCTPAASCGSATTAVNAVANITLNKTGPASAGAYASVPYSIALGNSGQAASSTTITVADALPTGMTFVGAAAGSGVSALACAGTPMLTCTVTLSAALPPGAANGAATFTINATAPSQAGTAINYASVDPSGGTNPPAPEMDCAPMTSCSSATTTIQPAPRITLSKAGPASVAASATAAYLIALGNSGEAVSGTTLTVADILPPGMTFVSVTPGTGVAAATCTGTATLKCTVTLAALQPGALNGAAAFTINAKAPSATGTVTNYASVDPGGGTNPPSPGANCVPVTSCGSVQTNVVAAASSNLTLAKAAPATAIQGASYLYTLRVGNSGGVASGKTTTVSEILPTGVSVTSVTPGAGVLSVDCGTLPITGDGATARSCTLKLKSAIAANTANTANGAAVFTLSATANALGVATNYASVDPAGGTLPPSGGAACTTTSCASAPIVIVSNASANLTLIKSGVANVGVRAPYTYTLSLGNSGATASGRTVTINDVLPAGVTVSSAAPTSGVSSVNCGTLPISGDGRTSMTCTVTLGAPIAAGAANGAAVVTLSATATATGKLTNYASIDSSGGTQPPTPGANCASGTACSSWTTQVHASGPAELPPRIQPTEIVAPQATVSPAPIDARWALIALWLCLLWVGATAMRRR